MAWYNINGEKAPDTFPVKDKDGKVVGWTFNPASDPAWREANGYTFDHNPVPPPAPVPRSVYTKLQIRRAMRALGMEAGLDAIIAANATFAKDWADAQEIDLADPVLVQALAAGGMTDAEIEAVEMLISDPGSDRVADLLAAMEEARRHGV